MSKACLILSYSGADLTEASSLADVAVTVGKGHDDEGHFQFSKSLAEYRQEHFAEAVEWTQKVQARSEVDTPKRDVAVYMVLAMAQYRLHRINKAEKALANGVELAGAKLPKLESGHIDSGWNAWLIAHTLMREAKALIEGRTTNNTPSASEPLLHQKEAQ